MKSSGVEGESKRTALIARYAPALTTSVRLTPLARGPRALADRFEEVRCPIVLDGLRGVEAEAVEAVVANPHLNVLKHDLARLGGAAEVKSVAPGGRVARGRVEETEAAEVV